MKKKRRSAQEKSSKASSSDNLVYAIIALSLIGLLTSAYLTYNHFAPPTKGSICDFGESVSCSLVNTSIYSELFNVPVAIFGAIWFIILILVALASLKDKNVFAGMLVWGILGLLFVVYMIIAEIILQSICPLCTIVHLIVLAILFLSYSLCKKHKPKFNMKARWLVLIIILNLIPIVFFNIQSSEKADYSELAQCVSDKGVLMYGSFKCGVCAKQRQYLGDAFKYIHEIECHPYGKNSQAELCIEKQLKGTPTWIMEVDGQEVKRHLGFMSVDELKEFSGCDV